MPNSVPALGRTLRRERIHLGLRLEDVALRTGLPVGALEALEAGTVAHIPDRVLILKILRRYADFVGLPGDRFALILIDHWPADGSPIVPVGATAAVPTDTVDSIKSTSANGHTVADVAAPTTGAPDATLVTGAVAAVGAGGGSPTGAPSASGSGPSFLGPTTAPVAMVLADTGVSTAVPRDPPVRPKQRRSLLWLRVVVSFVAVLVLIGAAGLIVNHYKPEWIHKLGITSAPVIGTPATSASGTTHTSAPKAAPPAVTQSSSSSTAATYDVHAAAFQVDVVATGGASWVQATNAQGDTPAFAGVLNPGERKVFNVNQSLTLQIGSRAGHVYVAVGKRLVSVFVPTVAPFLITYQAT
jgi:transcriptional regulator with XRE-family HTH domain